MSRHVQKKDTNKRPSAAVKLSFSYRTPLTSVNLPLLSSNQTCAAASIVIKQASMDIISSGMLLTKWLWIKTSCRYLSLETNELQLGIDSTSLYSRSGAEKWSRSWIRDLHNGSCLETKALLLITCQSIISLWFYLLKEYLMLDSDLWFLFSFAIFRCSYYLFSSLWLT